MRQTAIAVIIVLTLVGCGDDAEQTELTERSQWRTEWISTRELVPSASTIEARGEAVCGEFLGEVRARREELLPSPIESADESVEEWIGLVEGIGLDCPHDDDEVEQRLAAIAELTARIDDLAGTGE